MNNIKLSDRQKQFCLFYLQSFSPKRAAEKVGYSPQYGYKLMKRESIRQEIKRQKELMQQELGLEGLDVLNMYMQIAFADICDYVEFGYDGKKNYLRFKDTQEMDGRLIEEVTVNTAGGKIKLLDRFKALEKLEKFTDLMGADSWRKYIEEQRIALRKKGDRGVIQVITGVERDKEEKNDHRE